MTSATCAKIGWIDMTVRPEGPPEVDVNDITGELELTWRLEGEGGRLTLLIARDSVAAAIERLRQLI